MVESADKVYQNSNKLESADETKKKKKKKKALGEQFLLNAKGKNKPVFLL